MEFRISDLSFAWGRDWLGNGDVADIEDSRRVSGSDDADVLRLPVAEGF